MSSPVEPVDEPRSLDSNPAESAATTAGLQSSAMRASFWTAVQALIGLPLAVIVNLVVARSLGPHGFGVLASYMVSYGLILTVLNAGISDATIQWGAAAFARGDRRELLDICRRCAGFHLLVEAPLGAVAAVILLHSESLTTQLVAALAVGATMFLGTTVVVMTAMSMNSALAKLSITVGLAVQLALVTAAVQSHAAGPTWVTRLAVSVLAPAIALLLAPRDIRRASFAFRFPRNWPEGFAAYSTRTLGAGLVTTLVFSRSEILVLDVYGAATAAGLFALAAGLAVQITAPIDAMLGPLIPAAASLVAVSRERASAAVLRGIRLSALATAPIAVTAIPALAVLAPVIYGNTFTTTGSLFISLGVISCVQSVLHPVTAFVAALRKPVLVLMVNSGALVVDLALVFALAPVFGATGAVIGNSAGQVVSLAALTWILCRELELNLGDTLRAVVPFMLLAGCVAAASAIALIARHNGLNIGLAVALGVGVASAVGGLAMRAAGGTATDSDLDAIRSGFPRAAGTIALIVGRLGWVRPERRI